MENMVFGHILNNGYKHQSEVFQEGQVMFWMLREWSLLERLRERAINGIKNYEKY